jgi:hypothetical protein
MKIACDVKGTLEGPKKKQVLKILDLFARAGYEVTIWSNSFGYAVDAVRDNNLRAQTMTKKSKSDMENDDQPLFNFAIEDDKQQWYLGATRIVYVDEIPEDLVAVELFVKELLDGQ